MNMHALLEEGQKVTLNPFNTFVDGTARKVWMGSIPGTDVATADLVTEDGATVAATVASGTRAGQHIILGHGERITCRANCPRLSSILRLHTPVQRNTPPTSLKNVTGADGRRVSKSPKRGALLARLASGRR